MQLEVIKDYVELCKPRVVALMILTSIVGMALASSGAISLKILVLGNLGIALGACSAAAINHFADHRIDRFMQRTQNRPVAQGRISTFNTVVFAAVLGILSMWILMHYINFITALMTFLSLIMYAGIYTCYLKYATSQNIVIGGIAGASPPLLGWLAVTGQMDPMAWVLVMIIFVWTPPHFWALAINRFDDYAKAKVPMLPNTHGILHTKKFILYYGLLLLAVTLLPFAIKGSGLIYLLLSLMLNAWFLWWICKLLWSNAATEKRIARKVFNVSIIYLMLLFVALLLDHYFIV